MATYALTIAGVTKQIQPGTLRINETINGRNRMGVGVLSANGTYRLAMGAEVLYTEDSTRLFGGTIDVPSEQGVFSTGGATILNLADIGDFNSFVDRRVVTVTIPAGTLKAALLVLVTYLSTYGVTLDAAQVTGPAVPELIYGLRPMPECLNELSVLTGYVWEIDYNKVLRMIQPGSSAAPFNVVPASDPTTVNGDIAVETVRNEYANRIIVLAGTAIRDVTDTFAGDGSTRAFVLTVPVAGFPRVSVNGVSKTVGVNGEDTNYEWTYRQSDNTIVQLTAAPPGTPTTALIGGDTLSVVYSGQHPFTKQADDAGEQASQLLWEKVIEEPNVYDPDVAQALADAYLTRYVTTLKRVTYYTYRGGIHPGQTQTITVPDRNLSGTFLITDVEIVDVAGITFSRKVTAVGGTSVPPTWRDLYRQWSSSSPGVSSPTVIAGRTVTTALSAPAYLGGARNQGSDPSPAAWSPVPNHVLYTAPSSFGGRVRATIFARSGGITAQARLYNVTDAAVVATSSGVTSTTPTEVTFLTGITAGKTYRLEILSSAAGEAVYGIGVLESA